MYVVCVYTMAQARVCVCACVCVCTLIYVHFLYTYSTLIISGEMGYHRIMRIYTYFMCEPKARASHMCHREPQWLTLCVRACVCVSREFEFSSSVCSSRRRRSHTRISNNLLVAFCACSRSGSYVFHNHRHAYIGI